MQLPVLSVTSQCELETVGDEGEPVVCAEDRKISRIRTRKKITRPLVFRLINKIMR
jgi:hypothetical protein